MSPVPALGGAALLAGGVAALLLLARWPASSLQHLRGRSGREAEATGTGSSPRSLTVATAGWWGHHHHHHYGGWGHRRHSWGGRHYHHHHHGWHHWYALPGLAGSQGESVSNGLFWSSVFRDAKLLRSFAVGLTGMDEGARRAWEASIYSAGVAAGDAPEVALWDGVFANETAARRFALWLAELGEEGRAAWEQRVSEAWAGTDNSSGAWKPSWGDLWNTSGAPAAAEPLLLTATGWWGDHGDYHEHWGGHSSWGCHHHYHHHHGGYWHGWYALPETENRTEEVAQASGAPASAKPLLLASSQWWGFHGHDHGHWGGHGSWGHQHHHYHHYHHHHGGHWHGWYALPEPENRTEEAAQGTGVREPVSNEEFWGKVFEHEGLLQGFAAWLRQLGETARREWEQSLPELALAEPANDAVADGEGDKVGEAEGGESVSSTAPQLDPLKALWAEAHAGDATEAPAGAKAESGAGETVPGEVAVAEFARDFWHGVFEDGDMTSSFAAWLAELGDEQRHTWEQTVSEVAEETVGKPWQSTWPRQWELPGTATARPAGTRAQEGGQDGDGEQ